MLRRHSRRDRRLKTCPRHVFLTPRRINFLPAPLPLMLSTVEPTALFVSSISGSDVGALRKHAGGMFLASDLGGYAAVASIWFCTARQKWVAEGRPRPRGDETPLTLTSDPHTGRRPNLPPRRRLRRWSADGRTSPVRHRRQTRRHSRSGYPPPPHNSRRQCSPRR